MYIRVLHGRLGADGEEGSEKKSILLSAGGSGRRAGVGPRMSKTAGKDNLGEYSLHLDI